LSQIHLRFLIFGLLLLSSACHGLLDHRVEVQQIPNGYQTEDWSQEDPAPHFPQIVDRTHPRVEILQQPAIKSGADAVVATVRVLNNVGGDLR
jgi:hypothetical protein